MQIMLPVIRTVDVLLVGATVHACALARGLRQSGYSVFAVTPFSYLADDLCSTLELRDLHDGEEEQFYHIGWYDNGARKTPMQMKHMAERRFIQEDIDYMYQTYPVTLARDKDGKIAGVAVANRSGFQIVAARVIIDATRRELVARLAGAECASFVPGDYEVSLRLVGGAASGEGLSVVKECDGIRDGDKLFPLYKVSKKVRFSGNTPLDFARADAEIRQAAWHPDAMVVADCCEVDLRDGVAAGWKPSPAVPVMLAARTQLDDVKMLLEQCRPGAPVRVDGVKNARRGDIVRQDKFFRFQDCPQVPFDLDTLPGGIDSEVLVVGGGTGGAPAAIAAARAGAKTVCVESTSQLGGISTAGLIGCYYFGNRVGYTKEIDKGTAEMGQGRPTYKLDDARHNIRWKAAWFLREAAQAGVDVFFNSLMVAAVLDGQAEGRARVAGAVIVTPAGLFAVNAQKCVDATGNNDLVAAAGGETTPLVGDEPAVQGAGLSPVLLGNDCVNSDFSFMCDCDVLDATRAFTMAHGKFADKFDSAPMLETRERRRIIGEIVLQPQDFYANRMYTDTVNIAFSNFDTHGFIIHPMFMLKPTEHAPHYAKVPFRAMLPRNLEGVVVTGLGMSAHRDCMPLIRMQPDVHNQGFAAGTAAAMAVARGQTYRQLNIKDLQRILVDRKILPPETMDESDQIGQIAPDDSHYDLARYFLDPEAARAEIRARFAKQPEVEDARILAFLDDASGKDVLAQAVKDAAWDKGWQYTGMGQFGMSVSRVDSMLFALARIGGDADAVLAKLRTLRYEQEFSHIRAVCMALIAHPDARAAEPLTALLQAYGASGHATRTFRDALAANRVEWNDTDVRNLQLKELYLAKALQACDRGSTLAASILHAYQHSLNGYYALFAGK